MTECFSRVSDYYDYVSTNIETYTRLYGGHSINPMQEVRLFLVAPSFSQTLINRCKWLTPKISLFRFNCLKFDGENEIIPVFSEQLISTRPPIIEIVQAQDHLDYITDEAVRCQFSALMDEIRSWKPGSISLDPISWGFSVKVNGRVFAYLCPRRKHYIVQTYNADDEWTDYSIRGEDDLAGVKTVAKAAMDRKAK